MRFNFNKILNEKHALKAFSRGTKENNLVIDLNNKLFVGLNLPKSQTYPQISIKNNRVSKINPALKWNLASRSVFDNTNISFLEKPLIDVNLSNSLFYRRSYIRKKKSLLLYRDGFKGGLRPVSVRSRFLRFCRTALSKSSVSSKLYYLNLHSKTNLIFQRPKISCVTSKLYTVFDRKNKNLKKHFSVNFKVLSKSFIYSSIQKKFQKKIISKNTKNIFSKILTQFENKKLIFSSQSKDFEAKKNILTFAVLKRLNSQAQKSESKDLTFDNSKLQISQTKALLENYLQLNETNKEKIKKTIETANIEFIKSDLFKIRSEQFGKYTTGRKLTRSKRSKKFYKGKSKDFLKGNSRSATDIYRRLQSKVISKTSRSGADKSKFSKKSNIKSKLSIKIKKSKV